MTAPRLLSGRRRILAIALGVLALGQALAAVMFAEAIDSLLRREPWFDFSMVAVIGGLAVLAGLILFAERWVAEIFAQSFVIDCRAGLFEAAARNGGSSKEARWLTGLMNDMAALRNYALRGTVRLWTSTISAFAAAMWMVLTIPHQRLAMIPLAVGGAMIVALIVPLSRTIARQRSERGKLNRFLMRRVRAETSGNPSPRGHGYNKLAELSSTLRDKSVRRAATAGIMDSIAVLAGSIAAMVLVLQVVAGDGKEEIAGGLTLIAFVSAQLLETSRALHARTGGKIALVRLMNLINRPPPAPDT